MAHLVIDWDAINRIPVRDVLNHFGVKVRGSRFSCAYKGTSNKDGSFDKTQNLWNCFWCQKGGNNVHLAAHMLGKGVDPLSLQESAIYLGELFEVGLTEEEAIYDENTNDILPSLFIRKDVLDLIGLSKNPLLPTSFFATMPNSPSRQFKTDEMMFADYEETKKYCEKIRGEIEVPKSTAVTMILNHCHEALSELLEKRDLELATIDDAEYKSIISEEYQQKIEQINELIDRARLIYEKVVPEDEKTVTLPYEEYDEVFQ